MLKRLRNSLGFRSSEHERGQVFVLFIAISSLVFVAAVGAIDLGTFVRERQQLEIAVDAAVLAGGLELPDSGAAARSKALQFIAANDADVISTDVLTTFRCLVGDRDGNGAPDSADVPGVCNPGSGASWTCADGLCVAWCTFVGTNTCNVLTVAASKNVNLYFTSLLGLAPVTISASQTGACKGLCGNEPTIALDMIIVLDRTTSMSSSDLAEAKDGALAILEIFNPELQHVGLAVLGAGDPGDKCNHLRADQGGDWLMVGLSDDYKNPDDTLNTSSELVSTIQCLTFSNSSGTNLGSPLSDDFYHQPDALTELLNSGRPDSKKGIIMMSDGEANRPSPMPGPDNQCDFADQSATAVKNQDIEIFTIGYGVSNEYCNDDSGPYDYERVTDLLANMATDSADDQGHCANTAAINAENADGDHFLCQAKGSDLEAVFVAAANALSTSIRIIAYPE
jgi:Flp pilus assembly protein TadG